MSEKLFVDTVIDRYYIKYRNEYEPYALINTLYEHINIIFTFKNFTHEYVKERIFKILSYQEQLKQLSLLPVLEQRSQAWYDIRKNLITASDFAQALGDGKFGTQKQFFQKKCGYEKDTFDNTMPALKWGVKYEPVAIDAYATKNNVKMYEFGLLIHPKNNMKWFGASPDSISELGIMVEIKCPWRRKITGEVPKQYYYQVQGQLDVCSLQECDFLECEFIEYDNADEFRDYFNDNMNERGIIIEYLDNKNETCYKYSLFTDCHNYDKLENWRINTVQELNENKLVICKTYYWQLNTYSVVRIYKEDAFLQEKFGMLKDVWDKINNYKADRNLYKKDIIGPDKPNTLNIDTIDTINIETVKKKEKSPKKNGFADVKMTGWAFVSDDEEEN
jgi:putative phage-type endonuclease